eukprot:2000594-Pyramimonas_sp.AAC.1
MLVHQGKNAKFGTAICAPTRMREVLERCALIVEAGAQRWVPPNAGEDVQIALSPHRLALTKPRAWPGH